MEIRATTKDFKVFRKIGVPTGATITEDAGIDTSVIMVHSQGKLLEWTRGRGNIISYLKHGYVRIRKNCPYRIGRCRAEKCSLYVIKNSTGDCAHVWTAVLGGRA